MVFPSLSSSREYHYLIFSVQFSVANPDYYYYCFKDLNNKLEIALGIQAFRTLQNSITEYQDEIDKIAHFLLSPSSESKRQEIIKLLVKFPILRYRIHYFATIGFNADMLRRILNEYTERTTWHIRRIYRIRNSITHSGIVPENIKSIGDHLHSYVDTLLEEVIFNLASESGYRTIENVLLDIIISSKTLLNSLTKKDLTEREIVDILLHSTYTI